LTVILSLHIIFGQPLIFGPLPFQYDDHRKIEDLFHSVI